MEVVQVHQLVDEAFISAEAMTDRAQVDAALVAQARLASVVANERLVLFKALSKLSATPETDLTNATRSTRRQAKQDIDRLHATEAVPQLGEALADGAITPAHVDKFRGALGRLAPAHRARLIDQADELTAMAEASTADEFEQHLRRREREITADDGQTLFEAQKRATRLREWIGDDGMHNFKGSFDPLTGLKISNLLRAEVEALFHGGDVPADAPDLPVERQAFLRAHALLSLLGIGDRGGEPGRSRPMGRPEITIVIDTRVAEGAKPAIDLGLPIHVPLRVVRDLFGLARIHTVWVDGDQLVWAPGTMRLGNRARVASADQRRALRALYSTCAIPGCAVRFDDCDIHHVVFWEHGHRTDLEILVPLCWRHHHSIHDDGWEASIDCTRRLTIRMPNGAILTGTPNRIDQTRNNSPP